MDNTTHRIFVCDELHLEKPEAWELVTYEVSLFNNMGIKHKGATKAVAAVKGALVAGSKH